MPVSEARSKANKNIIKSLMISRSGFLGGGGRQVWQKFAASKGEPLNMFVCRVVNEAMAEKKK